MFHMLGPTMAARKMAKVSAGNASQASVMRMIDLVHPAAEIAREDAEHGADDAGEDHRGEAHHHRDPGAEDQPRQHVAPKLVGAEQVVHGAARLPERRMEARGEAADLGIMRRQDVGEDRHEGDDAEDDDRDHRHVAAAGPQRSVGGSGDGRAMVSIDVLMSVTSPVGCGDRSRRRRHRPAGSPRRSWCRP